MRRALSPLLRAASSTQNFSQLITSSRGSKPRWESSGRAGWPSSGAADTNSSPNVRGSTKRNCPPWVNVMTTWVWGALATLTFLARCSCPLMPRWTTSVCPSSSPSSRYFPARSMDLRVWPSNRARKCLALWWRRTVRPFLTSTVLIFRPTTSLWRSRRMVSTSGSSGIPPASLDLQRSTGRLGGGLLGVLLGPPLPRSEALASNVHRGQVPPSMIGPETLDLVAGNSLAATDGVLLEPALVIGLAGLAHGAGNTVLEQGEHQPFGLGQAAIEVDGADDRFGGIGKDGVLGPAAGQILTPTQPEELGNAQVQRHLGQDLGIDDRGPHLGHQAVGQLRMVPVGVVGHDQAQHRVTKELEPLVGSASLLLGAPRSVGHGLIQERRVVEAVTDPTGQPVFPPGRSRVGGGRHRAPQAPPSLA